MKSQRQHNHFGTTYTTLFHIVSLPIPGHTSCIQPPNPIPALLLLHLRTSTHFPTSTTTPPCQLPRTPFNPGVLATRARICAGACPSLRPAFSPLTCPRAPGGNVGACFLPCCLNRCLCGCEIDAGWGFGVCIDIFGYGSWSAVCASGSGGFTLRFSHCFDVSPEV